MKVNELVEMYKRNARIDIAKQLEVKQYVGIESKRTMAKLVLENCTYMVDGEIHIDSIERYLLFTIATIALHTNLEFYDEDETYSVVDDYDALCETGLLVKIIDTFKDDYVSCQEILNMITADRMQDNVTIEKKIYNVLDTIQATIVDAINDIINKLGVDAIDELAFDQEKLLDVYKLLNKE